MNEKAGFLAVRESWKATELYSATPRAKGNIIYTALNTTTTTTTTTTTATTTTR